MRRPRWFGTADDVETLTRALDDPEPLVRAHTAWALGSLASPAVADGLRDRPDVEMGPDVREDP